MEHGLRRVIGRHLEKALDGLKQPNHPDAVHKVRKEVKKMRALLRLARGGLKHPGYRKIAGCMRLAAKPLGAPRDALVLTHAFARVSGAKGRAYAGIHSTLAAFSYRQQRQYENNGSGERSRELLERALKYAADFQVRGHGWRAIKPCLKKTYGRGRQAYLKAGRNHDPTELHAWRKRVKDLRYQLDFLCRDWPPQTRRMLKGLKRLGDEIGDDHDLFLLEQFVRQHCAGSAAIGDFGRAVEVSRRKIQKRIWNLGSRFYRKVPGEVCKQFEKDWKKWRHHP